MPEYPPTILTAIAAVIAALIAAVISFISLISSKEEKVSEFRQAWIDSIREEMSCFIALLKSTESNNIEKVRDKYNRILFRLNPKKDSELIEIVNDAYRAFTSESKDDERIKRCERKLQKEFPKMLKTEWERVKKGESIYKVSKWIPLVLILIVLIIVWALVTGQLPFAVYNP